MVICCGSKRDPNAPIKYEENRSCTDCPFLLLFFGFWVGFVIIAGIAFSNGDPNRILYGTDYLGFTCGQGTGPSNLTAYLVNTQYQSPKWSENTNLWIPLPTSLLNANLTSKSKAWDLALQQLKLAVCVKTCPSPISESLGSEFDVRSLSAGGMPEKFKIYTYGNMRKGANPVSTSVANYPSFYPTIYNSEAYYQRCVPTIGNTTTYLKSYLEAIPEVMQVTQFFFRGISEIASSWRVILICVFIALIFSFVYVQLMRIFVKPLIYGSILFVLFAILGLGWFLYEQSKEMDKLQKNQPEQGKEKYIKFYEYLAYIVWGLTALYVLLVIWFWSRINEAAAMIQIAGRIITSSPFMLSVPVVISLMIALVLAWSIAVAVYIYTADDYTAGFTLVGVNITAEALQNQVNATIGTNFPQDENTKRNLIAYVLFGYLWSAGLLQAIGFTVLAFCSVFWYYSSQVNAEKTVPGGSIFKATKWTLLYHTGTLAFGSFMIATVQFIRIWIKYMAYQAEKVSGNTNAFRFFVCVADCIICCFEKLLKVISKNAYIMMCITSESFCWAAKDAFNIILDNAATLVILNIIEEIVIGLGKFITVVGTVILGFAMMHNESLAPNTTTRILPLLVIAFMSYFISSGFFSIYTICIDTTFICYHQDVKDNSVSGQYFIPEELEDNHPGLKEKRLQKAQASSTDPISQSVQGGQFNP